jgi:FkbM family methyltransferase
VAPLRVPVECRLTDQPFFDAFFRFLTQARSCADVAQGVHSEEYKFLAFAAHFLRLSKAQLLQDVWVLHELETKRDGYFVEFGAADGTYLSNTFLLEKYFGWSGALSEPNPAWHEALRKSRTAFISRRCIAGRSNGSVLFNNTPLPEFSTIEAYTSADMHAQARQGGRVVEVETQSLAEFLAAAGAPRRIDYLSIDTEGSEYEILSSFDLASYEIELITVEHNYTENRQAIFDLLTRAGYRRKFERFSRWDDWYVRDSTGRG